jgi:hydrophobic/amphiphilic exporter-1 (mainly G- bacteria), HAE1 family
MTTPDRPTRSDAPSIPEGVPKTGVARFIVSRPVAVTMLVSAVCVFGAVSLSKLPTTLLPELSYPTLTVRVDYPGAAPREVEELVVKPLEENLAVVSGLNGYRSVARAGGCDILLEFGWDAPMNFAAQDVREKTDQILPRLPRGVERPLLLRYDPSQDPILRFGLSGDADLVKLREVADRDLKRRLEGAPGVAAVKIKGGFEKEIRVELDEEALRLRRVTPEQVTQRLQTENVNVPGGVLRDGDVEYLVRTLNEFRSPEEIGDLVVDRQGGVPVRVKDLGRVVVGAKERDVISRIDGRESVEIEIYKEADANLVDVARSVKDRLFGADAAASADFDGVGRPRPLKPGEKKSAALIDALPIDSELRLLSDQSIFIEAAISEVRDNAAVGAVLAIAVLFLFLRRYKPTLIVAASIPVSVAAAFAPLYLAGVSLNIMSLGGLALGVGMLVDNSIVVLEAIARRRDMGESVFAAAVNGVREMGLSVVASTTTTIVVFLPIVFVEGAAGRLFKDQALAVVFSLLASLGASVVLVPMLSSLDGGRFASGGAKARRRALARLRRMFRLSRWPSVRGLRAKKGRVFAYATLPIAFAVDFSLRFAFVGLFVPVALVGGLCFLVARGVAIVLDRPLRAFDVAFQATQNLLGRVLTAALRARAVVLLAAIGAAFAAYGAAADLKRELIPSVRQGLFFAEISLDVGASVERTDERLRALEAATREAFRREGIPLASVSTVAGVPRDVVAKPGDGPHTGRLYFRLGQVGDAALARVEDRARDVVAETVASVPGVGAPVVDAPQVFQASRPLEIAVVGDDPEALREAAALLEREVATLPGVSGVRSTVRRGRPEIVVRPDREALSRYGLSLGDVAEVLRSKVQGKVATYFSENDRKIEVRTILPEADLRSTAAIAALQINPGAATPIPLSAVARVEVADGPSEIRRAGGRRAEVVSAELAGLDLGAAGARIRDVVARAARERPDVFRSVTARLAGQNEEAERSAQGLFFALLLAVFLVYLVMAAQFESLVHPFTIMFTIPLALIGVVFTLRAFDVAASVVAFLGVILLAGIVVNNAIILVDTVNRFRRDGMRRDDALVAAARVRLRPIVMTTATTVLGLLPLALGLGEGAEIRRPMAVVVVSGLAASTLLTLIVVPVVYSLLSTAGPIVAAIDASDDAKAEEASA